MKKWLSYIFPVTSKIQSQYNGMLEVTWYNGTKMLNTKNANYSYGSLQKILKIGLEQTSLNQCENILLLGMGGGSVIQTLRSDFKFSKAITAIEIDPTVIEIAEVEFGVKSDQQLNIICDDAGKFIHDNQAVFDLIIIDLFLDTEVPKQFLNTKFWLDIKRATAPKGQLLCNIALNPKEDKAVKNIITFLTKNKFKTNLIEQVNGSNTLLLAKKIQMTANLNH